MRKTTVLACWNPNIRSGIGRAMVEMRHQIHYRVGAEANFDLRVWLANKHRHLYQRLKINIALPWAVSTLVKTTLFTAYQYQMTAANTTSMWGAKGGKSYPIIPLQENTRPYTMTTASRDTLLLKLGEMKIPPYQIPSPGGAL